MLPLTNATELNTPQISQMIEDCIESPMKTDISAMLYWPDIFAQINAKNTQNFFNKYQNLKTFEDVLNTIENESKNNLWEIIDIKERELIINILKENNLNDQKEIINFLNLIISFFLSGELFNNNSSEINKLFETGKEISDDKELKNKLIVLKPHSNLLIPKEFHSHNNFIEEALKDIELLKQFKKPPRKPVTPNLNVFIYSIVELAKNASIKNHYSDFVIPVLKQLKAAFPNQFREIKKFEKVYLMNRAREGSQQVLKAIQ